MIKRVLKQRPSPRRPSLGRGTKRALLYVAVIWLIGIQAYFYVDLLIDRRGQVSSVFDRLGDLFR
jgi:hypothetical protein